MHTAWPPDDSSVHVLNWSRFITNFSSSSPLWCPLSSCSFGRTVPHLTAFTDEHCGSLDFSLLFIGRIQGYLLCIACTVDHPSFYYFLLFEVKFDFMTLFISFNSEAECTVCQLNPPLDASIFSGQSYFAAYLTLNKREMSRPLN